MAGKSRLTVRWGWLIPLLLLACGLAGQRLTAESFSADEVASMIVAGGAHYGPFTPLDAWNRVAENSPDQAVGLALFLSAWGRVFGWSEYATRLLPLFAGVLALAMTYRVGHDLFSHRAGLVAVAVLCTSVYFITYMHILRVFTLVALVVVLTVWSYWRIMLCRRSPRKWAYLGLLVGGIGLFYTHYFATPLLIVLGVYHLLLAPRTRNWWRVVGIAALVGIAFLPELSVFLRGFEVNLGREELRAGGLPPLLVIERLVYLFDNGAFYVNDSQAVLLIMVVVGAFSLLLAWRFKTRTISHSDLYLMVVTLGLIVLIIAANEQIGVMTYRRMRYLMALWPLLALLVGMVLARLHPWVGSGLLILVMAQGLWSYSSTDLRYDFDEFSRMPLYTMQEIVLNEGFPDDLLMVIGLGGRPRDYYTVVPMRRQQINSPRSDYASAIGDALRLWVVNGNRRAENYTALKSWLESRFVLCQTPLDDPLLLLELYARVPAYCPGGTPLLRFGESITLTGLEPLAVNDGLLQVDMSWTIGPDVPLNTYSIALHIYQAGELVAQGDTGLPYGPVHAEIDVSTLPPGDYAVRVGIYAWETGERLPGVDVVTGAGAELMTVGNFSLP